MDIEHIDEACNLRDELVELRMAHLDIVNKQFDSLYLVGKTCGGTKSLIRNKALREDIDTLIVNRIDAIKNRIKEL